MTQTEAARIFNQVQKELDRAFCQADKYFHTFVTGVDQKVKEYATKAKSATSVYPQISLYEDDSNVYVEALTPGVEPEKLSISLEKGTLTIEGEKPARNFAQTEAVDAGQKFSRKVQLSDEIQADQIEAEYKNGVLTVKVPKANRSSKIEIKIV